MQSDLALRILLHRRNEHHQTDRGHHFKLDVRSVQSLVRCPDGLTSKAAKLLYAATVMMLKEAMFVLSVLHDLGYATEGKLPTLTDSKSGRDVIRNPGVTKHTAHFARWLHWARELYMQQKIEMILVEDSDMMADCDTKIVDRDKFFKCIKFQMNL